jgi:hypothetical protein
MTTGAWAVQRGVIIDGMTTGTWAVQQGVIVELDDSTLAVNNPLSLESYFTATFVTVPEDEEENWSTTSAHLALIKVGY